MLPLKFCKAEVEGATKTEKGWSLNPKLGLKIS